MRLVFFGPLWDDGDLPRAVSYYAEFAFGRLEDYSI